jgi:hypothetical protein
MRARRSGISHQRHEAHHGPGEEADSRRLAAMSCQEGPLTVCSRLCPWRSTSSRQMPEQVQGIGQERHSPHGQNARQASTALMEAALWLVPPLERTVAQPHGWPAGDTRECADLTQLQSCILNGTMSRCTCLKVHAFSLGGRKFSRSESSNSTDVSLMQYCLDNALDV